MIKPDSLIFDMDGTLWDALDIYVASWNKGFKKMKIDKELGRKDLDFMMGWEKRKLLQQLLPDYDLKMQDEIYNAKSGFQAELIAGGEGSLYEGVKEGIIKLSAKYKLFIVSNCGEHLIRHFMQRAQIEPYITDEMAHGVNSMPKHHNIKLLVDKYNLQNPVYIGDTETDSIESKKAGLPFVFLSYGFGKTEEYDLKFDDFTSLTDYFMGL